MSPLLKSIIIASLAVPCVAMADNAPAPAPAVTANVALVSNYLYRGISQTGGKPAIQGGFDYAHSSGFYAGVWGSNISWISDSKLATNASVELDTYIGFKNSFATDFNYDVGFLRYNYPGTYAITPGVTAKADTNEVYGLIGYKWLTAKYSYSLGDTFGIANARGTDYIDVSANYPVANTGITLGAHYGKQDFKGVNAGTGPAALSYHDYKLSVTKDLGGYALGLAYSKTNASAAYTNVNNYDTGKGVAVLSLAHSF
jgi:uncharacterized protein (TIGR02001 family)